MTVSSFKKWDSGKLAFTEADPYTAAQSALEHLYNTGSTEDLSDEDFERFKVLNSTEPGRRSLRDSPDGRNTLLKILESRLSKLKSSEPIHLPAQTFTRTAGALALVFGEQEMRQAAETGLPPGNLRLLAGVLPMDGKRLMQLWGKALVGHSPVLPSDFPRANLVYCAAYMPEHRIVAGHLEGDIGIYDAKTCGEHVERWLGHTDEVRSVAVSPDRKLVASGSEDESVRLWNADTGEPLVTPNQMKHQAAVNSVAFLDNGRVVSGSSDRSVRIWDAASGTTMKILRGHSNRIWSVACAAGQRSAGDNGDDLTSLVASGSADWTIRIWNADTGACLRVMSNHKDDVRCVAFSFDGSRLVSASDDETVLVFDMETYDPMLAPLKGHDVNVWSVAFSPDGHQIASGSDDGTLRLWNAETGDPEDVLPVTRGWMRTVVFSPDENHVACVSANLTIWDTQRWNPSL